MPLNAHDPAQLGAEGSARPFPARTHVCRLPRCPGRTRLGSERRKSRVRLLGWAGEAAGRAPAPGSAGSGRRRGPGRCGRTGDNLCGGGHGGQSHGTACKPRHRVVSARENREEPLVCVLVVIPVSGSELLQTARHARSEQRARALRQRAR